MYVCIIEAGQNEMPADIKYSRRWTGKPKNVRIIAYGCDQCPRDCQRTRQGLPRVPSMDVCVDDDVVDRVHSFRYPLAAVRRPLSAAYTAMRADSTSVILIRIIVMSSC